MKVLTKFKKTLAGSCVLALTALISPGSASGYPVDCAILLCLSGGWPASAPCAHARAVFIRRITPWPIEPPLQIWRCPMLAAMNGAPGLMPVERLSKVVFSPASHEALPTSAIGIEDTRGSTSPITEAVIRGKGAPTEIIGLAQRIAGTISAGNEAADIDISGPEFEFVRSIRVWDVRHFSHVERGRDDDCEIRSNIKLGTYGVQGQFRWQGVSYVEAPSWVLPIKTCSRSSGRRGVGVEWRDYDGNHGYEWVAY